MQQINLLDRRLLPPPPDWLTRGVLSLAALGLLAMLAHLAVERTRLARVLSVPAEADLAETPASVEINTLSARVAGLMALRQSVLGAGTGIDRAGRTLTGVAAALDKDMWLDEVELRADRSLRVTGRTLQAGGLPAFTARLQQQDSLRALPVTGMVVEVAPAETQTDAPAALRFVIQAGTLPAGDTP